MRSGTSFFDWTVFKKTICRFWPLWGAYSAIWLVLLPLNGLMLLRMDTYQFNGYASGRGYMENFAMSRVPEAAEEGCLMLVVVFGVLAAMAVFSHLYNARSANLFGSLPVRREGLFLTHYLAGLCFLVVPNAVIFVLTLIVEAAGGSVCMQGLLFWLAASCGEGFFFYSMAVFCAMFTGHILALPVFYGILNGLAVGITGLVQLLCHAFYYGFSYTEVPGAVRWLTPVVQLWESVGSSWNVVPAFDTLEEALKETQNRQLVFYGWGTLGIYAAAALALTVCAFFLYRARRLESAGDVVSVKVMRPVFKYGVAMCAGLAFGVGTVSLTGGGEITLMIAIVVWGAIGYFAAQMLLDKSFRVFKKWKGAAAVTAVFIALFLVVGFDLTGFETRIPDPASVEKVRVDRIGVVYLGDDGDGLNLEVTDPEVIKLLSVLHREAVAQRDGEWQTQAMLGGRNSSLQLDYTLQGGGAMSRRYTLWINPDEAGREGTAAWAVQQIYNNRDLYWQAYGFDKLEEALAQGWRLERAGRERYDNVNGSWAEAYFYGADASALLAAVKEDFLAGRIGVRRIDDEEHWHGGGREDSLAFTAVKSEKDGQYYVQIAVQDTASSTLAALEGMAGRAVTSESLQDEYRW